MSKRGEEYLGDGLYASFDGWQFRLRAPRDTGDHEVYMDDSVFKAFIEFVSQCHPHLIERCLDDRQKRTTE